MSSSVRVLSLKLGSDPSNRGVVSCLRDLIPNIWIAGVEEDLGERDTPFDLVVTSHTDAYLGHYVKVDLPSIAMTPELSALVAPFEGQALNMLDRVRFYDPSKYPPPLNGVPQYEDTPQARGDLFYRHCRFWNHVLDVNRIDAVISQNFGHQGFDFVALSLARAKGIPTLIFNETSQFPRVQFVQEWVSELGKPEFGRSIKQQITSVMISEDPMFIRKSLEWIHQSPDQFGIKEISTYTTSPVGSWLMDLNVRRGNVDASTILRSLSRKLRRLLSNPSDRIRMARQNLERVRTTRKSMREEGIFAKTPRLHEDYIYFPLHFQPEATTSVKGRNFYRLREAVSFVASGLPEGWTLVVKEHPHQWRRLLAREPGFFAQLAAIPRVQLVHHSTDNNSLVNGARAVVCVSHSSITAHSMSRGIPVISLGDSHFRRAPNYFCIENSQDLRSTLKRVSASSRSHRTQDFEEFIVGLEESTFEGVLGYTPQDLSLGELGRIRQITEHNISRVIHQWLKMRGLVT